MAAASYDFLIEQGATFSKTIAWKNDAGVPVNLTGYTARMHIRKTLSGTDPMISLTTENGRIALDSSNGRITLTISATDTSNLTVGGVYDLELVAPSGVVTRLIQGVVELSKEVTRG